MDGLLSAVSGLSVSDGAERVNGVEDGVDVAARVRGAGGDEHEVVDATCMAA
jgi:hypothetical protein